MNNYDFSALHEQIKRRMRAEHISQEDLAEILGVTPRRVNQALNQEAGSRFTIDQYIMIADKLEMTLGDLFNMASKSPEATPEPEEKPLTVKDICQMLFEIYNSDIGFKIVDTSIKEEHWGRSRNSEGEKIYAPHEIDIDTESIYFRSVYDIDEDMDYIGENFSNYSAGMYVNQFLKKLKELSDLRDNGTLDESLFQEQVQRHIDQLPEYNCNKLRMPAWLYPDYSWDE